MFQNFLDFFGGLIVKVLGSLPSSPFDVTDSLVEIRPILGYINWFIPFYIMADTAKVAVAMCFGITVMLLVIKWLRSR